jgi:hypothetical protein
MLRAAVTLLLPVGIFGAAFPMVTVDTNGNIRSGSATTYVNQLRYNKLVATAAAVAAAPISGTASLTTVTALASTASVYDITVPSSLVASGGVSLPTPAVGLAIDIVQGQTTAVTFTIWVPSGSTINGKTATTLSVDSDTRHVQCFAISATRWDCFPQHVGHVHRALSATTTLSHSSGDIDITYATSNAITVTLPACVSDSSIRYKFVHTTADALVLQMAASNYATGVAVYPSGTTGTASSTAAGTLTFTPTAAFAANTANAGVTVEISCGTTNIWTFLAYGSGTLVAA